MMRIMKMVLGTLMILTVIVLYLDIGETYIHKALDVRSVYTKTEDTVQGWLSTFSETKEQNAPPELDHGKHHAAARNQQPHHPSEHTVRAHGHEVHSSNIDDLVEDQHQSKLEVIELYQDMHESMSSNIDNLVEDTAGGNYLPDADDIDDDDKEKEKEEEEKRVPSPHGVLGEHHLNRYKDRGKGHPKLPEHLWDANQDDPELIAHIRQHWVYAPHTATKPNLHNSYNVHYSQYGQSEVVDRLLNNMPGGFYVESGAGSGEKGSNTLFFELHRGWEGILIEPNPLYFEKLLKKKRRAFLINACLSPTATPVLADFYAAWESGGIVEYLPEAQIEAAKKRKKNKDASTIQVQCFPLYSILAAVGRKQINYFSLDVEGPEEEILDNLPMDKMSVDVFSVEKRVLGSKSKSSRKKASIKALLESRGYNEVHSNKFDIIMAKL